MFLDHIDSFGKFLNFLPKHIFFTLAKKRVKTLFCCFLKNTVSLWISLAKIV